MDIKEAIKNTYLVRGLSDDAIAKLAGLADTRIYQGGDVLIRQFDKETDLMVILQGSARINTFSGDELAEVGPGSIIGEISLLDDQPRSATVVSTGGTTAAVIPNDKLRELMEEHPNIALAIYRNLGMVLASRLRTADVQLDGLMAKV